MEGGFVVPKRGDSGTLLHLKLPRRKGLAPGAGAGPSTGPEEEVAGAG